MSRASSGGSCMQTFRVWGFDNFSVYLTDEHDIFAREFGGKVEPVLHFTCLLLAFFCSAGHCPCVYIRKFSSEAIRSSWVTGVLPLHTKTNYERKMMIGVFDLEAGNKEINSKQKPNQWMICTCITERWFWLDCWWNLACCSSSWTVQSSDQRKLKQNITLPDRC